MSQLLEFKIKPFEAIHFRQSARLVSTDMLVIEKHKALARRFAFAQGHQKSQNIDMNYVHKVNQAFSTKTAPVITNMPALRLSTVSSPLNRKQVIAGTEDISPVPGASSDVSSSFAETSYTYTQQRGSFEVRVAAGDLTYIPAIEMTIITSWPEVDFTYTGGFNYVPPREDSLNEEIINLKI